MPKGKRNSKPSVKDLALNKALKMLDAVQANYKVVLPDGREFGALPMKHTGAMRRNPSTAGKRIAKAHAEGREWGDFANYIKPKLEGVKPGEVVIIPKDKYDLTMLSKNVSNYAGLVWGRGTFKSLKGDTGVEVLRIS